MRVAHGQPGTFRQVRTLDGVTILEYERGLLYRGGKFERLLGPGRYRLWPFSGRQIVVVDIRRTHLMVDGQKVLTADQVAVTLSLAVTYEVVDLPAAVHRVVDFRVQVQHDVQFTVRTLVSGLPLDVLLGERVRVNGDLLQAVQASAADYGVRVLQVGLQDVVLSPYTRQLLQKERATQRRRQRP
jgi:regulator of protease activity HflC (stomatin/prohibitin superfamily)